MAFKYETLILLWRVTEDNRLVLIDRAHSQTAVRVEIKLGYRMPLLAGAVGRCVAATLQCHRRNYGAVRGRAMADAALVRDLKIRFSKRASAAGRSTTAICFGG